MNLIQAASAVYVLVLFGYFAVHYVKAATSRDAYVEGTITGWPLALAGVAIFVCVITTLIEAY